LAIHIKTLRLELGLQSILGLLKLTVHKYSAIQYSTTQYNTIQYIDLISTLVKMDKDDQ